MEQTVHVKAEKRRLGRAYALEADGRPVGQYELRALGRDRFEADGLVLSFEAEGLLLPRFRALRDGEVVAALDVNPVTGRLTLHRGAASAPVRREGFLLPRYVVAPGAGAPVLELETERMLATELTATLRPSEAWPREWVLAALALLLHARTAVGVLWTLAGAHPAYAPV